MQLQTKIINISGWFTGNVCSIQSNRKISYLGAHPIRGNGFTDLEIGRQQVEVAVNVGQGGITLRKQLQDEAREQREWG